MKSFLRLALLAVLAIVMAAPESLSQSSDFVGRPNFVVFMIDDLDRASVSSMTVVNQRLASQGMTFSQFFATTPLCCPSRASFLRGQYAHNHGVLRNTGESAGFGEFYRAGLESVTMATLLNDGGYETALVGKYLNGYSQQGDQPTYIPPGWDYWAAAIDHAAYGNYNYELNVNGEIQTHGRSEQDYLTDVIADRAIEFLDGVAATTRPFFLYVAPFAPHSPSTPARRHKGMFTGEKAPRTPAFNERNLRDKANWLHLTPRLSDTRVARIDEGFALRLEALQAVDELVGAVVQRVEEQGLLDSTYFIFLSDNGYFLGEHRQPHGKDAPYDAAARVPFIISGPGIPGGASTGKIALNIDVLPTMLDLAGISMPAFVDGRSLRPLLEGNDRDWRRSGFIEGFGKETESNEAGESSTPPFRALRTERILYVEYESGERELYDLDADPYMLSNINRESSRELRRVYAQTLDALSACAGSGCQSIEDATLRSQAEGAEPRERDRPRKNRRNRSR